MKIWHIYFNTLILTNLTTIGTIHRTYFTLPLTFKCKFLLPKLKLLFDLLIIWVAIPLCPSYVCVVHRLSLQILNFRIFLSCFSKHQDSTKTTHQSVNYTTLWNQKVNNVYVYTCMMLSMSNKCLLIRLHLLKLLLSNPRKKYNCYLWNIKRQVN